MLTTSVDGLWVLQILTGTEIIAPELGLRPHLPSFETTGMAMSHPAAAELKSAGVIDGDGTVDAPVAEWLTVLSRRDVSLLVYAQTPRTAEPERILLARFASWWVALERCGEMVRITGMGAARDERAASLLIKSQLDRLCGTAMPADFRPASFDASSLLRSVHDGKRVDAFLSAAGFDPHQIAVLASAAEKSRSAQLTILALQSGVPAATGRSTMGPGAVTVLDTPFGRLTSERVFRDGHDWMVISPGSSSHLTAAVQRMLRNLPARNEWFSYRKAL